VLLSSYLFILSNEFLILEIILLSTYPTPWSIWYLITNNPNPNPNILLSTYPTPWPIWYLITNNPNPNPNILLSTYPTPWPIWYLITNNPNPNILLSTYPTPWPIWYLITCILTQLFNLYTYCEGKIPLTQIHDCWWGLANVFHMQVKCQPSHITSL
jgi:hypothetical protein